MTITQPCTQLVASPQAKGLIFDLDGTLIDSIGLHWQAWKNAFLEHNIELDYNYFISLTGKPIREIAEIIINHYNKSISIDDILNKKEQFVYNNIDKVTPIEPVVNIVRTNYGHMPMAVGTGSDHKRAELMLENAGILNMFNAIICAEDVEKHKPAPDTFLRCAELINVEPKFCQVFEDGELGLQAARTANMIYTDVKPFI